MKRTFSILLSVLLATQPMLAANVYIRDGQTGDGSSWTNALDTLPATLTRGNTYYVADGTYAAYDFNDAESGTTTITIKKATTSDYGGGAGWDNSYGDGVATFGQLSFSDQYYVIDGSTRNESDWSEEVYGFRTTNVRFSQYDNSPSRAGKNVTFKYVNVGGTKSDTFDEGHPDAGFYFLWDTGGSDGPISGITIQRCYIHNVDIPFQLAGVDGVTVEYSYLGPGWQKETIRGQTTAKNVVIRHNIMKHGCQTVSPTDPQGRIACTAQIAIWDDNGQGTNAFDNVEIYGNVIIAKAGENHSDAAIFVGGNQSDKEGYSAKNCFIYNNTIVDVTVGNSSVQANGVNQNATNKVFNNLFYNVVGTPGIVSTGTGSTSGSNGEESSSSVFINYATYDLRLSGAIAGTSLGSPYNTDLLGNTRGSDGVFDRGAYEYDSGGGGGGSSSGSGKSKPGQGRGRRR